MLARDTRVTAALYRAHAVRSGSAAGAGAAAALRRALRAARREEADDVVEELPRRRHRRPALRLHRRALLLARPALVEGGAARRQVARVDERLLGVGGRRPLVGRQPSELGEEVLERGGARSRAVDLRLVRLGGVLDGGEAPLHRRHQLVHRPQRAVRRRRRAVAGGAVGRAEPRHLAEAAEEERLRRPPPAAARERPTADGAPRVGLAPRGRRAGRGGRGLGPRLGLRGDGGEVGTDDGSATEMDRRSTLSALRTRFFSSSRTLRTALASPSPTASSTSRRSRRLIAKSCESFCATTSSGSRMRKSYGS